MKATIDPMDLPCRHCGVDAADLRAQLATAETIRDAAREASARDLETRRTAAAALEQLEATRIAAESIIAHDMERQHAERTIEYKHLYKRDGGAFPKAHTQCGQDVDHDQVVNLVGDLAGIRIFACCVAAIGAD